VASFSDNPAPHNMLCRWGTVLSSVQGIGILVVVALSRTWVHCASASIVDNSESWWSSNHSSHHVGSHHHHHNDAQFYIHMYSQVCRTMPECTCKAMNITAPPSYNLVSQILDDVGSNNATFLALEFMPDSISRNGLVQLDKALAERPWWWAEIELQTEYQFLVILQHTPRQLSEYLGAIAKREYPSPEQCASSYLETSNHAGDTWGIRWTVAYESSKAVAKGAVFHIHVTNIQGGRERPTYFTGENDCAVYKNKWECLFLPTTNCTLPNALTSCTDTNTCYPGNLNLYSSASSAGTRLDVDDEKKKEMLQLAASKRNIPPLPSVNMGKFRVFKPQKIPELISLETAEIQERNSFLMLEDYQYYLGIGTRFNSFFRMKLQRIGSHLRYSFDPPFLESSECVALHIRQDDRNIPGVADLDDWCNKCSIMDPNSPTRRQRYKDGCPDYDNTDWFDKGCASRLPFGKATLVHYINASIALNPKITNYFIMTDDINWLHEQKKEHTALLNKLYAERGIRLLPFPVRPEHRRMALQGAEDFWASINIARQCSAFVGHFGSAATQIIYRSLCYRSNNNFAQCPDIFDIANVF
jgi:hypothetical protein